MIFLEFFFWLKQVEILVFDVPKPGQNKKKIFWLK